jgi:hypothetical protein
MGSLSYVIGREFERFFYESFSGFINTTADKNVPDFYNPEGNFWIETKAGNQRWGPRIQEYQIKQFKKLNESVVYALGFHNFDHAHLRLSGKSEKQQKALLRKKMRFGAIVFINSDLISSIWDKDSRTSKKDGEVYLTLKPSTIRNLVQDRSFKRFNGIIPSSSEYYEFQHQKFSMVEPWFNIEIPSIGTVLHKEKDSKVLKYLKQQSIF